MASVVVRPTWGRFSERARETYEKYCHDGPFSDPNDASRTAFALGSSRIHAGEGQAHDG